jgi:hypothetical protein
MTFDTSSPSLEALRIACRDESQARLHLDKLGTLHTLSLSGNVKALQVLCNLCFHVGEARQRVFDGVDEYVRVLDEGVKGERLELTLRLLFFATIKCGGCSGLRKACFRILHSDPQPNNGEQSTLFSLRILYNICNSIDDRKELTFILSIAQSASSSVKVYGSAINVLLRADPTVLASVLDAQKILLMISRFEECTDKTTCTDYLPSLFTVIKTATSASDSLRHHLRPILFNSAFTTHQLRTPHPDLVLSTGDMLMALVKGNVARFIHGLGGYGRCAGYLHMRNIAVGKVVELGESSDEEYLREHGFNDPSLPSPDGDSIGMTEEEKEQEAERLLDLFERLEKTGVFKLAPPHQ